MTSPTNSPLCCGMEAKFVNNGPSLQYYYCSECKNEVTPALSISDRATRLIDAYDDFNIRMASTKLEEPSVSNCLSQVLDVSTHLTLDMMRQAAQELRANHGYSEDEIAEFIKYNVGYSEEAPTNDLRDISWGGIPIKVDPSLSEREWYSVKDFNNLPPELAPRPMPKSNIVNAGTYLLHWYPGGIMAVDYSNAEDQETLSEADQWNLLTISGPSYFEGNSMDDVCVIPLGLPPKNERPEFGIPEAQDLGPLVVGQAGERIEAGDIVVVDSKTGKLIRCRS